MIIYIDGQYIDSEKATPAQKALLMRQRPILYQELYYDKTQLPKRRLSKDYTIYQIWYNEESKERLDGGFIPYDNRGTTHNFENDVIMSVWLNHRREWMQSKYVGVLSWRFKEKTNLTSKQFKIPGYDVIIGSPKIYGVQKHPYVREGCKAITDMCKMADYYNLFPFKLYEYPVNQICWCNYWIATPKVFDDYCTNYLNKAVSFFRDSKIQEVKELYEAEEPHRQGKPYKAFTFFLEGLFSLYLSQNPKLKILEL